METLDFFIFYLYINKAVLNKNYRFLFELLNYIELDELFDVEKARLNKDYLLSYSKKAYRQFMMLVYQETVDYGIRHPIEVFDNILLKVVYLYGQDGINFKTLKIEMKKLYKGKSSGLYTLLRNAINRASKGEIENLVYKNNYLYWN